MIQLIHLVQLYCNFLRLKLQDLDISKAFQNLNAITKNRKLMIIC